MFYLELRDGLGPIDNWTDPFVCLYGVQATIMLTTRDLDEN